MTRLDIEIQGKVIKRNFTKRTYNDVRFEGVPLDEQIKKIQPGWEGKVKEMLQVLWELGFLDVDNLRQYTVYGQKDAFGNLQHETSLKYLLGNCTDFEEEEIRINGGLRWN